MTCNKNKILKEMRDEHNLDMEQVRLLNSIMAEVAEELRLGDEAVVRTAASDTYEDIADSYEGMKTAFVDELNRQKPRIQHTKSKSDGYVVPITIDRIQNGTAYYRYPDNKKIYEIPADSKHIKLDTRDMDTMIRELTEVTKTYGSKSKTDKVDWEAFDRMEKEVHGNKESMKSLIDELVTMEGVDENAEHVKYLKDLIDKIPDNLFTKMQTFIKSTSKETSGVIQGNRLGVYVSNAGKMKTGSQGAAEVYVHEVMHSITTAAIELSIKGDVQARALVRDLEYVMAEAQKRLTWKDFMPKESVDKAAEEKVARETYKYIFEHENAKAEFIAYVLTNKEVMEKMQKIKVTVKHETSTMLEKIGEILNSLLDIVLGKYSFKERNQSVYDHIFSLTTRLGDINKKAVNKVNTDKSLMTSISELIDEGNTAIHDALQGVIKKYAKDDSRLVPLKEGATKIERVKWHMQMMLKVMRNDQYRNFFGHLLSKINIKPEGTTRDWFRAFFEASDLQKSAEFLGTASDSIDRIRNSITTSTKSILIKAFDKTLSEDEEIAMTRVLLDTDVRSIYGEGKYSLRDIGKILSDDEELNRRLSRAKHALKMADKDRYSWHVDQAHGLGIYMATHQGHIAQNLNAYSIVAGVMSSKRVNAHKKKDLVALVDEVATLTAIKYTNKDQKAIVAKLIKEEKKGIDTLINVHNGFEEDSRKNLFDKAEVLMIKGYTKEVFDDKITMEIAPVSRRSEMETKGFKFVSKLDKATGDTAAPMAMYISDAFITNEWQRTATRMTRLSAKGTSLSAVHYRSGNKEAQMQAELDKHSMDEKRIAIIEQMEAGTYDASKVETGIVPILDQFGNVTDYRYMMDKVTKQSKLGQDVTATEVLSRSNGSTFDKLNTLEHHKKVIELILKNMEEDWIPGSTIGKTGLEYVLIGPDSTVSDVREIYKVLPPIFKDVIDAHPHNALAIPRELMHVFFGYRHLSITDSKILRALTPAVLRNIIKIAETMWIEAIKIYKGNILLRMPFVLIGNIISNIMYAIATGNLNIVELMNGYKESFRDVRKYINEDRELTKLMIKDKAGLTSATEKSRIKLLQRNIKDSPIKELMDMGLYQSVVEDVENMNLETTNKWKQVIDKRLENVPVLIKAPLQWMYLSSETKWYKINQEVLQMSDLIARDVENRRRIKMEKQQAVGQRKLPSWWVEKYEKDKISYVQYYNKDGKLNAEGRKKFFEEAKKVRHYGLLENYVNYNMPSSKFEEYLNRIGAIMFTKYTKRIQKIIASSSYTHPINAIMLLLGQGYVVDVETIQDQALFTRSWSNFGFGPGDSFPFHNPAEQLMDILTPAIIKPTTWEFIP